MLNTVRKNNNPFGQTKPKAGHTAQVDDRPVRHKPQPNSKRKILFAGVTGFAIGIVFWHIVGFWAFVGDVLMTGSSENSEIISRLEKTIHSNRVAGSEFRQASHQANETSARVNTDACTELVMDRVSRTTYAAPCAETVKQRLSSSPLQTASRNSDN